MHRTKLVVALFSLGFVSAVIGIGGFLWPPAFFDDADRNQFLVEVILPPGSPVSETDASMREVEAYLEQDPDIFDWTAYIGAGVPKFYYNQFTEMTSENVGMFVVNTQPELSYTETRRIAERMDEQLKAEMASALVFPRVLKQGYGGGPAVRIFVEGDEFEVLRGLAKRIMEIVETVPGTLHVRDNSGYDPLTLEVQIDPARANLLGINHRDVAMTLRTAVDGVSATSFRDADEKIDVTVRLAEGQRRSIEDLNALPVFTPTANRSVALAQVASIEPGFISRQIMRWNRKREVGVIAELKQGESILAVGAAVEKAVRAEVTVPPGYEISFHGQRIEVMESFLSLARAAVVAVFMIYIILVIQFRSLSQPLLIILAIPMALIGATGGLILTGHSVTLMAFLGLISLIGIVVNDSIVLLDFINRLRAKGQSLEDAVLNGATSRLRAITLTSVTTIGGLLPLTLAGNSLFVPFGVALIFGLIGSTALTLLVQPAAFLLLERRRLRKGAVAPQAASLQVG